MVYEAEIYNFFQNESGNAVTVKWCTFYGTNWKAWMYRTYGLIKVVPHHTLPTKQSISIVIIINVLMTIYHPKHSFYEQLEIFLKRELMIKRSANNRPLQRDYHLIIQQLLNPCRAGCWILFSIIKHHNQE